MIITNTSLKNHFKIILQLIPYHTITIDMLTKYCENLKKLYDNIFQNHMSYWVRQKYHKINKYY